MWTMANDQIGGIDSGMGVQIKGKLIRRRHGTFAHVNQETGIVGLIESADLGRRST